MAYGSYQCLFIGYGYTPVGADFLGPKATSMYNQLKYQPGASAYTFCKCTRTRRKPESVTLRIFTQQLFTHISVHGSESMSDNL